MGSFCDYLEDELLDHVFGASAYSAPATVYIALSTTEPTDAGGNVTEPSGGNYARCAVTNDKDSWTDSSGGALSNEAAFEFNTASGDWGTIAYFVIYDALTSGNALAWGAITTPKAVGTGDTPKFNIGDLDISLT